MVRPVLAAEPIPDEERAFLPSVGVRFVFDSNTYDSSTNPIESWIGVVSPAILFSTSPGPQRYLDPSTKTPAFKACAVRLERIGTDG